LTLARKISRVLNMRAIDEIAKRARTIFLALQKQNRPHRFAIDARYLLALAQIPRGRSAF